MRRFNSRIKCKVLWLFYSCTKPQRTSDSHRRRVVLSHLQGDSYHRQAVHSCPILCRLFARNVLWPASFCLLISPHFLYHSVCVGHWYHLLNSRQHSAWTIIVLWGFVSFIFWTFFSVCTDKITWLIEPHRANFFWPRCHRMYRLKCLFFQWCADGPNVPFHLTGRFFGFRF